MDRSETLPRVLIVSVNPLSQTNNNGKTIASFFDGYPIDKLAQLYFHRELPNSPVCERYFRISDEQMVKSFLPWRKLGGPISPVTSLNTFSRPTYLPAALHNWLKMSPFIRWVRSWMWMRTSFRQQPLAGWLDEYHPQAIFFCGGDAANLYPKVTAMSKRYGAPIILFITDDYVLGKVPGRNPFRRRLRSLVRHQFHRLWPTTSLVITIGEKMTRVYRERFGMNSVPAMNGVDRPSNEVRADLHQPVRLVYAGGLHTRRWESLAALGKALDRQTGLGGPAELHVHTAELPPGAAEAFAECRSIKVRGFLGAEELAAALAASDILVHVESFDPDAREVTWLSVSTKIPEYFAQGRTVLAIGPADLASIEYIAGEQAGFVASSLSDEALDAILGQIAADPAERARRSHKGLELVARNHDQTRTRDWLASELRRMVTR